MPIVEKQGDMFDSDAPVLVHGVNTKGVWGAGIALQFKKKFPEAYKRYYQYCMSGSLRPGRAVVIGEITSKNLPLVAVMATQEGYGGNQPAKLEWVRSSAKELATCLRYDKVKKIAMPRIGCGLGGLDWQNVKPIIEEELSDLEVEVWSL